MAQAEIAKIGLLGTKSEQEKIIEAVYDFGGVQIIDIATAEGKDSEVLSKLDYNLAQVKFALDFVDRYAPEIKVSFKEKMEKSMSRGIAIKSEAVEKIAQEYDYQTIIKQAEELEAKINLTESTIVNLKAEIEELEPWRELQYNYQNVISDKIKTKVGILTATRFEELNQQIAKDNLAVESIKVSGDEREVRVALIFLNEVEQMLNEILSSLDYKDVVLPDLNDKVSQVIENKLTEINQQEKELEQVKQEAEKLYSNQEKLQIVFDYLTWQRDKVATSQQSNEGLEYFYLTGFIAKDAIKYLSEKINKFTDSYHVAEIAIADNEEVPVILKNNSVVSPFESVTNIYGAPKSEELDPTPFLAPFFILFFGICLSDAGYGLLLGGFSFLAIKLMKIPREKQGFFRLLIYAGISTFIIGALFGGWFGLVLEDLPQNGIVRALLAMKVIDPVTNPLIMLIFSLILGGMQVIAGIVVNLYYQITRKDWGKVFDASAWLFFILAIVFWLVAGNVLGDESLQTVGKYWIWLGVTVLVLTQGRRQKNIFLKLPLGILSLYDLVGYFSDIMSYSRLLALGLSTGIIAMVINMVAMLFKDMIPFIGWPVAILILIGGHLFNLAINALGSFIHSGRLQYVEFFPKFMEGGGTRFKPLQRVAKYVDIYSLNKKEIVD